MAYAKTLVLVDGSSLAFRSFYALFTAGMRKADGTPTWAVYGFFKALFDLLEQRAPDMMAVCFDVKAPTFRHAEYEKYKANRQEMPDDLACQWPVIKEGVEALSIPVYEMAGFEADDIIGTVAVEASRRGFNVVILTGDQDAFQLLDDSIAVLMPGKSGLTLYGRQAVHDKLGVFPEQIIDYKALCGDASDNIPGVRGIGPKTAVSLLGEDATLDAIYQNLDKIGSKSVRQKLIDGRQSAYLSRKLATIQLDVPINFDFEHCRLTLPDIKKVAEFFRSQEFHSILKRLPKSLAPFNCGAEPVIDTQLLTQPASQPAPAVDNAQAVLQLAEGATGQLSIPFVQVFAPSQLEPEVVRTVEEMEQLLSRLSRQTVLSVDLETTGAQSLNCDIVGYALSWSDSARMGQGGKIEFGVSGPLNCVYIPVRHVNEDQLPAEYVASCLKPILESPTLGKIAQNAKYEMNVLSLEGVEFAPLVFDPMLASYIINPDDSHGLEDQSERILHHKMVRIAELIGTGRKLTSMADVPVAKAAPSAGDDARVAFELAAYYNPRLDADQRFLLFEMEQPLTAVLSRMEQAGVALDLPYLSELSAQLASELTRLESEIHQSVGHSFNINSPQQLQKVLFEELHLPVNARFKTKSGGYSTDASVLEQLRGQHPVVAAVLEYRQNAKLRSTYVEALPRQVSERDNRLHGEFNQVITATGRLSSSNPNLQNIPIKTEVGRKIRRAFVPSRTDSVLISADYSQIELRLLAHMSGDETLIEAFRKGEDIHTRTAAEIFDIAAGDIDADQRRVGKTLNFSLVYQQGAYSTAQDLGISRGQAQTFIDKYFQRYPQVRSFMARTVEQARRVGYATTLWGRRRYFSHLNDRNETVRRTDERAAGNAPLQGSAADLMKLAMIRLDEQLAARGLTGKVIMQVHDELVLEVPASEAEETRAVVLEAMELDQPLSVPLKVDTGTGATWMDT